LPSYEALFRRRGDAMPMHWYEHIPIWAGYAPQLWGDRAVLPFPDTTQCDVECEVVWVTGRDVRNCDAEDGLDAILGLCLMATVVDATRATEDVLHGQWSRPAGVVMGPVLTCVDELVEFMLPDGRFRIDVRLLVNDVQVSHINLRDVHYTMGSAVAHACDGQSVEAASVFSSGVVMSLSLAGGAWLVPGDAVEIDAGPLGALRWTMEG
jgi:2-keto-4-pentenoate hydratase/2-oxohepta-3-ene-1,7-dioic acid hydratase in catechol pathway